MSKQLSILNTKIRNLDGLFSLTDLHKASGGEKKHQPALYLANQQTKELIAEIESENSSLGNPRLVVKSINGGNNRGTYACNEIILAYATWISPKFHLTVLRAFMEMNSIPTTQSSVKIERLSKEHQTFIKNLVMDRTKLLPKDKQAKGAITQWSALKTHFGKSYKEINDDQFVEAVSLLARLPLEGELIIDEPKAPAHYTLSEEEAIFITEAFLSSTRYHESVYFLMRKLSGFRSRQIDSVDFNYNNYERRIRQTLPVVNRLLKQLNGESFSGLPETKPQKTIAKR